MIEHVTSAPKTSKYGTETVRYRAPTLSVFYYICCYLATLDIVNNDVMVAVTKPLEKV